MLARLAITRNCLPGLGLGLALACCAGCQSLVSRPEPRVVGPQTPPHYGEMVPTEKDKTTLPSYVIEPPDILFIEAVRVVPKPPYHIQATDVLTIQIAGGLPEVATGGAGPGGDQYLVDSAGRVDLGPLYGGKIEVGGLTEDQAALVIQKALTEFLKAPQVSVQLLQSAALQPITGEHLVAPDGRVLLDDVRRYHEGTFQHCLLVTGVAVDVSPAALSVTLENARRLGVADRLTAVEGSWYDAVAGRFDVIVSNPPYIPHRDLVALPPEVRDHEPRMALVPPGGDAYEVAGRGELQLGVLIENMRREGFELAVSRPRIVTRTGPKGELLEPIEEVVIDVDDEFTGVVIDKLSQKKAELAEMKPTGGGKTRLVMHAPSRALIGYHGEFLTDTRGTGVMNRSFLDYAPHKGAIEGRRNGVLVSTEQGQAVNYALWNIEERGILFIGPGESVYQGMIIGENAKDDDLDVNPLKEKKLTNVRAAGKDEAMRLTPPRRMSLEQAIAYIDDDELVEVTPKSVRLRKKALLPHLRKKRAQETL